MNGSSPTGSSRPVHVEPIGVTFELGPDETLIAAAWREGYYWPTVCGGRGECTACHVVVEDGVANAVPAGRLESLVLAPVIAKRDPRLIIRLACQLKVRGPVRVHKKAVRRRIMQLVVSRRRKHLIPRPRGGSLVRTRWVDPAGYLPDGDHHPAV
jgi:ferredoxin, 2Fe-2S